MLHSVQRLSFVTTAVLALCAVTAQAGVTKAEADRLKGQELTPMGAERAANKDGSIPAWTGGLGPDKAVASPVGDRLPGDPYAADKPLFTINAANTEQYADKLTDGAKYLLKNYPGYKIVVFPSRRPAAAPQWVYDNTYQNALNASTDNNGLSMKGGRAGIPFPIPRTGEEVMHNNNFNWRGVDFEFSGDTWVIGTSGKRTLATSTVVNVTLPYYYDKHYDVTRKDMWGGKAYSAGLVEITAPAYSAGERALTINPLDYMADQPQSWSYLTGQRRIRKTPNVQYDVPFPYTSGLTNFDDANGFLGALDRFDWKLVGKKEIYIPYNTNGFYLQTDIDKVLGPQYANPDLLRWELHRVWIVDATLKPNARHNVPKKRFYVDEDTWWVSQTDQWDAKGQFWKTLQMLPLTIPSVPTVQMPMNLIYNVQQRGYVAFNLMNRAPLGWRVKATPMEDFTAQALERGGAR